MIGNINQIYNFNYFNMYKILFSFILTLVFIAASAQNNNFSVLYEITELDAEEIPMLSMLKGSTIEVTYGDQISKTDISMMFGMIHLEIFADEKKQESTLYFDMMGQKKYVSQPLGGRGLGGQELAQSAGMGDMELQKGKGAAKKIAGYKSTPYVIKGAPGGMGMTIYITKKLQTKQAGGMSFIKEMIKMPDISGFPMMLELSMEGMGLTLEAKEVSKSIDKTKFTQPTGYELTTMEELLGGMGGGLGGFGGFESESDLGLEGISENELIEEVTEAPELDQEMDTPSVDYDGVNELLVVDDRPEYIGGDQELYKFLTTNLIYPAEAKAKSTEGTVIITFVVEKDGSLSTITPIREVANGCTEEAMRVVKMMPKWKPGKANGIPVKVKYTLPVKFALK
jgi:TonB family protein